MTTDAYDAPDELPPALGAVVEQDRGSLPFELIHGEALVACAGWALGDSGVTPVDLGTEWAGLVDAEEPFVLHDVLCPLTPASFIAACLAEAVTHDAVVVGVRPVTDTVKHVEGGLVGATVDRDGLLSVTSPVVLPASVVAQLDHLPSSDFAVLVAALAERFPVRTLEAPASGRRVSSCAWRRRLDVPTMLPRGSSSNDAYVLETKASRGSSRSQIQKRPRPSGKSMGTSFIECTAMSASFSSSAVSSSLTNKPLPPIFDSGESSSLSPRLTMGTRVTLRPG